MTEAQQHSGKNFHCSFITPQGKILESDAFFVSAPGSEGSIGILAGHAPMISILKTGIVKIQKAAEILLYTIDAGILEVRASDHAVLILADHAQKADTPTSTSH